MNYRATHTFKLDLKNPGVMMIPGLNTYFMNTTSESEISRLNAQKDKIIGKNISLTALPPLIVNGHKIELQRATITDARWTITETDILGLHTAHKCLNLTVVFSYLMDGHGITGGKI